MILRESSSERVQAGGGPEGEAGFPLSREPNVGLDPRWDHDLSQRQPINQISHLSAPHFRFFIKIKTKNKLEHHK